MGLQFLILREIHNCILSEPAMHYQCDILDMRLENAVWVSAEEENVLLAPTLCTYSMSMSLRKQATELRAEYFSIRWKEKIY